MKILGLLLILCTPLMASAEVYTETGSLWHTECYVDDISQEHRDTLRQEAQDDACASAKQTCLEQHAAAHPSAVFHCEVEDTNAVYDVANMTSISDGTYCPYTNEGMDAAQYSCTVEVVPGAD